VAEVELAKSVARSIHQPTLTGSLPN